MCLTGGPEAPDMISGIRGSRVRLLLTIVCSRLDTSSSSNANVYTNSVPSTIIDALNNTRYSNLLVMIGASFLRGGRRITAGSTGSTPKLWLGGPRSRLAPCRCYPVVWKQAGRTYRPLKY